MRKLRHIAFAALVLATPSLGASGCADTRDDINRVQALAIRKSDLVGDYRKPGDAPDFYMRGLILGVHRTNPWLSDGLQDLTRRIRFEITENQLIARNGYEVITGSDGKGGARGKINDGNIVGIWEIDSQFDVRRDYSTSTGEEFNVMVENSTDRPWYEREFIRVDWSRNRVADPNTLTFTDDSLTFTPLSFFENDKGTEEFRSNFDEINKGYFDVTSRWLASPKTGRYGYPSCLWANWGLAGSTYVADPTIDCGDQEFTMRTAFWKVPVGAESTDYEVGAVTAADGDVVGTINLDRSGYDRNYGIVDDNWHEYMQRYNIWQRSHTAAACGIETANATDATAECVEASGVGSTCDLNVKLCTIPYQQRTVRPVVWYVDPALPDFFYPTTQHAIDEWNVALKRAVSYSREAECRKTVDPDTEKLGDRATCHERFFNGPVDIKAEDEPLGDEVVILCHNPVAEEDNAACGAKNLSVRRGDIRRHMVAWWSNPSFESPLGVIVPGGDPTTGEHIGTMANVFGATVTNYAARVRDQMLMIAGDITPAEYANGITVDWYANELPVAQKGVAGSELILNGYLSKLQSTSSSLNMTQDDIKSRLASMDLNRIRQDYGATQYDNLSAIDRVKAYTSFINKQSTLGDAKFQSYGQYSAALAHKMDVLKTNGAEYSIYNDKWTGALGVDATMAKSPEVLDMLSPLRGASTLSLDAISAQREATDDKLHRCFVKNPAEQLSFTFISGISAKLKARYADGKTASGPVADRAGVSGQAIDRVVRGKLYYQELLEPIYELTLIHEIGHLMSMNHDFSGSFDSPNFHPEYWILRAHGKEANMAACKPEGRTAESTDNCAGQRWLDPITDEELGIVKGKEYDSIDSFANASVMDYKPDDRFGAVRLGNYDKMAAGFIYGRVLEVIDEKFGATKESSQYVSFNGGFMNADQWLIRGKNLAFSSDYTQLGRNMNLFQEARCRPQTPAERDRGVGALGLTCAPPHKDHVAYDDFADQDIGIVIPRSTGKVDGKTAYRWPFKVGNGSTGYVHQAVFDNGADFYELANDVIQLNNLDYLGRAFRKEAREVSVTRSVSDRTFRRVQQLQWNALSDVVRNGSALASETSDGQVLGLTRLFDAMAESLLRPQPGQYVAAARPGQVYTVYSNPETGTTAPDFSIGLGDARYIESSYDLTKQYDYQSYGNHAGSFLDKPGASVALTDARPLLSNISRETYLDGRNVMFSFRTAIPQAFDRLIAGVMADDWDTVAPYVDPSVAKDSFGNSPLQSLKLWEQDLSKISRPTNAKLVDPLLGYNIKRPAMFLMLLYQPIDSNMELIQRTRIWQPGLTEAVDVPEAQRVVFFDPVDQVEWNAKSFGSETISGKVVEVGIGARMLQHANELLLAGYNVNSTVLSAASGQQSVTYVDGRPVGTLTVKNAAAAAELTKYVAFLNETRRFLKYLGYGPCNRGEDCSF